MVSTVVLFPLIESISLIFSQNGPRALSNISQPNFVRCSRLKIRTMSLESNAHFVQRVQDRFAVMQILVKIKNEIVKLQLLGFPSELPLQFVL